MLSIIWQIDHILTVVDDAERAWRSLTQDLGLPSAWDFQDYGRLASGGAFLGNVNLEVVQATDDWKAMRPARILGIAFEPAVDADELLAVLDERSIPHTPAMPFVPEGASTPFWTNVGLDANDGTFFCKYHMDVDSRRAELRKELDARDGGALGIDRVEEIVVAGSEGAAARWQRLVDPVRPDDTGRWNIGDGPAVRLATADPPHVVVRVRDVERAASAAGVTTGEDGLRIALNELGGLELRLV